MKRVWMTVPILLGALGLSAQKPGRTLRPQQATVQATAQEARVALVIGNGDYPGAQLKNPANDAREMRAALESCKFEVTLLTNASKRQMEDAIAAFGNRIGSGAVGLFYFAGHGLQVKGDNYLIPIGAKLDKEDDIPYEGVNVGRVLDKMEAAKNALNILILDACRNNPFARSWHRGAGEKGLATVNAPTGSLIAYATGPGRTAADGSGENGLYTEALLQELKEPGVPLLNVFQRVRQKVRQGSQDTQVPWESNSTVGDFYFRPLTSVITGPSVAQLEATYWEGLQDSRNPKDFESFLTKFPQGNFAELAKAKLANLRRASANVVVNNLAEPWKALQRDRLETKDEFVTRVAALGPVKVGTASVSVDNYDVDTGRLVLPIRAEAWAEPYVKARRVVLTLDRAQMRQLATAGGSATVARRFEIKDGQVVPAGKLILSTSLGVLDTTPPPPIQNAQGRPEAVVEMEGEQLALIQIPAGSFTMGTAGNTDSERQHPVTISRDFWMGKFPVTQGQWQAVMGNNPSYFQKVGIEAPVEQVSWEDAQQFLSKLNGLQLEWTFRLPTEAEWEYACRAGTEGETYGPLDTISWYSTNSASRTHPVGQKKPNGFGLYDMIGDVSQWCQDLYEGPRYSAIPSAPPRWHRGGSWSDPPSGRRSAGHSAHPQDFKGFTIGFRVVAVARTP